MGSVAQTIDCPKCGAPLARSGEQVTCSFCGTVSVIGTAKEKEKDEPLRPVSLGSPIWLQAWGDVRQWLWPYSESQLIVLPFADPYESADRPDCQHIALADRLAVETHLHVSSMVGVRHDGSAVLDDFNGPIMAYEHVPVWVGDFAPPPVAVVWAEWGADDSRDIQLRARAPAHGHPATVLETSVPVAAAADTVLDWLVARGRATRVVSPSWYARPPASLLQAYGSSIQGMLFFVLAKNRLLTALQAKMYPRYVEAAFALASDPQAPPQCRIFPLTLAILAAQMGALDAGHRKQALDLARDATTPGDLLTWIAPHLLRELGATDEAEARVKSLRAAPDLSGPYVAWLESPATP